MEQKNRFYTLQASCLGQNFDVQIFVNDTKLRSHTVKHLLSEDEWKKAWKKFEGGKFTFKEMKKTKDLLRQRQCPVYADKIQDPPCHKCPHFDGWCAALLKPWETQYETIIRQAIAAGFQLPRHAHYSLDKGLEARYMIEVFSHDPSTRVACEKMRDGIYNVKTAHHRQFAPYSEAARIQMEALSGQATFCTLQTWLIK